jgi:cystathionine beta-lyase/cystathionine gamma-synthase
LVEPAIRPNTKYLFIETPTNPMLQVTDIQCVSSIAHKKNVKVVVDNTFASPYIQRPLTLGADIVVHSTTKFLNGHSDSVGGVVILKHQDDVDWMKFVQNAAGAILGPMDSWLILRGTKTLTVRMERTNENAQIIAEFLDAHPKVTRTIYPGLKSHPHYALAKKQMRGFGGLISFDVGSLDNAKTFLNRVRLMALAESLGGVETLISHPAIMTHASVPKERRDMLGITDGLVRISVGIEDVEDLQADLEQALSAL